MRKALTNMSGFKEVKEVGMYLGAYLTTQRSSRNQDTKILDRVTNKLQG